MSAARKVFDHTARHLHRETRLADPARSRDRDQAHSRTQQQFFRGRHLLLPSHKTGPLRR